MAGEAVTHEDTQPIAELKLMQPGIRAIPGADLGPRAPPEESSAGNRSAISPDYDTNSENDRPRQKQVPIATAPSPAPMSRRVGKRASVLAGSDANHAAHGAAASGRRALSSRE